MRHLLVVISVHENVLFTAMTVKITKYGQLSLFGKLNYHLLGVVDCWMQSFARCFPSPIEVTASQRTSVISVNHAIWVKHGDYLKYKILSQ